MRIAEQTGEIRARGENEPLTISDVPPMKQPHHRCPRTGRPAGVDTGHANCGGDA